MDCPFEVADQDVPVVICNEELEISLGGSFAALHYAEEFDDGSFDQCGPIKIEVRRNYPINPASCEAQEAIWGPWSNFLLFTSCDVDQVISIELRVSDDRNQDGIPGHTILQMKPGGTSQLVADFYSICQMEKTVLEGDIMALGTFEDKDSEHQILEPEAVQLYQNTPNPAFGSTNVGFQLPQNMPAKLTFFNVQGKQLLQIQSFFSAGYNAIRVNQSDLKTSGIIYYTLETNSFRQTRKMVMR